MKVKIIDSLGGQYRCDSRDPDLIGRWLFEQSARLTAQGDGDAPVYLYMWPSDQQEKDEMGFRGSRVVTPANLMAALAAAERALEYGT